MTTFLVSIGFLDALICAIILLIFSIQKKPLKIPIISLSCFLLLFSAGSTLTTSEPLRAFTLTIGFFGFIISIVTLIEFNIQKKPLKLPTISLVCFLLLYIIGSTFGVKESVRTIPLIVGLLGFIASLTTLIIYANQNKPLKIPTISLTSFFLLFIGSTGLFSYFFLITCTFGIPITLITLIIFAFIKRPIKKPAISLTAVFIIFILYVTVLPKSLVNTNTVANNNDVFVSETTNNETANKDAAADKAAAVKAAVDKVEAAQAAVDKGAADKAVADKAAADAAQIRSTASYDSLEQGRIEAAIGLEKVDKAAAEKALADKAAAEQAAAEKAAANQAAADQGSGDTMPANTE